MMGKLNVSCVVLLLANTEIATRYGLGLHEKTLTEHQIHNYYVV